MTGKHLVLRGDARRIPLADGSVDLIVTSPPYFSQRSYRDVGEHYDGQIGSEPHPRYWLEAMFEVMKECWRILAPGGSVFVNLGDKRAGSGGHNNSGVTRNRNGITGSLHGKTTATEQARHAESPHNRATRRNAPDRYEQAHFGRRKSRQLLPERFAIGCEDGLADPEGIGWIVRQIIIWEKLNGLPESVNDRTRDNFEYLYHFTKSERYFAAVDEIREPQKFLNHSQIGKNPNGTRHDGHASDEKVGARHHIRSVRTLDPRGALPGSVWRIASEPLRIPDWAKERYNLPDHFAAFPTEIPRRLILGFSPSGICTACNEPRRPMVEKTVEKPRGNSIVGGNKGLYGDKARRAAPVENHLATITGYACRCPDSSAPTRNAVILDVFGGTGTTAIVAETLGRTGISLDLSADYCNLARWRIEESGHGAKAEQRTWGEAQGTFL